MSQYQNNAQKYINPQSNIDVNNNPSPQQIIIQPSNPPNYDQPDRLNHNEQIIIQPIDPQYEEQQPLSPNRAQNKGVSQDQIDAVLRNTAWPHFDEGLSTNDEDCDGIGCIEGYRHSQHIITWILFTTIGLTLLWWY